MGDCTNCVFAKHVYDNTTGCQIANDNEEDEDCVVTEGDTICLSATAISTAGGGIANKELYFWHTASGYSADYLGSCVTGYDGDCDTFCYILTPELRHGRTSGTVHVSAGGLTTTPKFSFSMEESPCATSCETACQSVCETLCQVGCEVSCESSCEVSCESTCEVYCQTACEATCETGCEVSCETADEVPTTVDFRIRVLDDVTLLPIENAYVDLTIGSDYTDAEGYTQWWEVDSGVLITGDITKTGYANKSVSITPLADATWSQYMVPEDDELPQLTVNSSPTGAKIYIQYNQTGEYLYAGYQTNITLGLPVGTHNVKVLKDNYEEPDSQTVTLAVGESETISFTLIPITIPCTYTGYSCDADINAHTLPVSANYGDVVEGSFDVDNLCLPGIDPEETRYKVKFILNDGDPSYSVIFKLGNVGMRTVTYQFTMPNQDSTLKVDILRCNSDGEWELAGSDASREYTIDLIGVVAGPFASITDYPDSIPEGNYDLGYDYHFKSKIKNIGDEWGDFRLYVYLNDQEIGNEPWVDWRGIDPGETKAFDSDISRNLKEGDIIRIEAWEQDKYPDGDPDHTIEIIVGFVECPSWAAWLATMLDTSCATAQAIIIGAAILILLMLVK